MYVGYYTIAVDAAIVDVVVAVAVYSAFSVHHNIPTKNVSFYSYICADNNNEYDIDIIV